jgi:tripartite-type tricarboxylate transporter receptor subunit TctC
MASAGALGRGLAVPPGVDKKVIATLRKAYDAMNVDKDFAAELKKRKLRLIASTGETVQKVVAKALKSSTPEVVARVRKIVFGGGT